MRYDVVPLGKLEFDLQNPRFEPIPNQLEALAAIARDSAKLSVLMKHIIENGVNPTERVAVIPAAKPGRYVVVEGNRRLAALKFLCKVQLLDGLELPEAVARTIKRTVPSNLDTAEFANVEVVIFDDRQEASTWIDLKHTGQNGGAGVVEWDGVQIARYRKGDAALGLLEFALSEGILSTEDLSGRAFPITSLRRLIGDPYVRQALGISLSKGALTSEFPPQETKKVLKRVVSDLATGNITVTDIKRKEDRARYVDSLPKDHLPNPAKRQESWSLSQRRPTEEKAAGEKSVTSQRPNKDRAHLIPANCQLSVNHDRLNKIYWELRRGLKVADAPNAVAVLFRAFVEMSVDFFMDTQGIAGTNRKGYSLKFEEKVAAVISHFEDSRQLSPKASRQVRLLLNSDSVSHPQTFHSFVHDRTALPTAPVMFSMWSSVEPLLVAIYN